MIRFLFVLSNFLEDPSVNHFCDVGILIKDYPYQQWKLEKQWENKWSLNAPVFLVARN